MRTPPSPAAAVPGAAMFARYAYPPNALGYCGPRDHRGLLERAARGDSDGGLAHLARGFDGAWPYLELIAAAIGASDPLERRVVEAYWLGNRALLAVDTTTLGASLAERFRRRAGRDWADVAASVPAGGVPHHTFHVLCVYPWVGLLRSGHTEQALEVIDRCRIRWARVVAVESASAVVRTQRLEWDGRRLSLGEEADETVALADDGYALAADVSPGDEVALHWHWVCDTITATQRRRLEQLTRHHLGIVNDGTTSRHLATVLG